MRVLLAGGSGFLGTHLRARLVADGAEVHQLVRRPARTPRESTWDPAAGVLDQDQVDAADVVINLAGSPTAGNPHSAAWARNLRESRVRSTDVLARAIARAGGRPAYLAGNGISFYGDRGDELLTEGSDSRGDALLTDVTRQWQAAARPAVEAGSRVCILRTAPVIDRRSAPLKLLLPAFKAGLGAQLGDGRQRMPMISLRDWVGATVFLASAAVSGPVNLCCERQPTNKEFTDTLARLVHRPRFLTMPAALLRPAAGKMAPELLGSLNVRPQVLLDAGYRFSDPTVAEVLATALGD
ncbi:MAG: TIGR01777 family oxidoreductase [Nocardioides sp.]